jgi:fimbrial chaperone protein
MVRAIAIATLLTMLPAGHALARGQLQAHPTLVELQAGDQAGRLVLANTGDAPVAAQVRAFAWLQQGGEDRLAETDAIAISPMITTIPPGGQQVVRVVRLGEAPTGADATYRLVVDELPTPDAPPSGAIELRLRYVVPLFVRARDSDDPVLDCRFGAGTLACRNAGERPAQLGATRLVDASGAEAPLSEGLFGYVLPGSERTWALPAAATAPLQAGLRLETRLNGEQASVPVRHQP